MKNEIKNLEFEDNDFIPTKFTCQRDNVSPSQRKIWSEEREVIMIVVPGKKKGTAELLK